MKNDNRKMLTDVVALSLLLLFSIRQWIYNGNSVFWTYYFCWVNSQTFPKNTQLLNLLLLSKSSAAVKKIDNRPMFHLWINQVVGFYQQNVWKTPAESNILSKDAGHRHASLLKMSLFHRWFSKHKADSLNVTNWVKFRESWNT